MKMMVVCSATVLLCIGLLGFWSSQISTAQLPVDDQVSARLYGASSETKSQTDKGCGDAVSGGVQGQKCKKCGSYETVTSGGKAGSPSDQQDCIWTFNNGTTGVCGHWNKNYTNE
jgi:hypothetical protein